MKHEKSCGVIAYSMQDSEPKILIICHRYGNHWAFPKGHVEKDETEEQTAVREVLEETGVSVCIEQGYRETASYSPAKGVSKIVVFFVGHIIGGALHAQPEEVRSVELLPYDKAYARLTYDTDKLLLTKAKPFFPIKKSIKSANVNK